MSMPFGFHKQMLSALPAAVLIVVALPIAACGSSSSSSYSSAASGASAAGMTDCSNHTVVRPKLFVLACGDGNAWASNLVWQDWGQATTIGRGIINLNLCDPDCATSKSYLHAQGTLTANRLQVCPDGQQRYTRLTYDYSGDKTGPVTMTVPCPYQIS